MTTTRETINCIRTFTQIEVLERSFGLHDRFGREIGARAYISSKIYEPTGTNDVNNRHIEPAEVGKLFYSFTPHATRAGNEYGASHSSHRFDTLAEAQAAAAKYFKQAEKRAAKIVANGK